MDRANETMKVAFDQRLTMIVQIVLRVHPEEWKRQWFNMSHDRRLCNAAELKGSYVYLASDASSCMTGKTSTHC